MPPDTGVADTPLFQRQATVGLEGRHGSVLVGRAFTSVCDFMLPYDPMGYAPAYSWAPTGHAGGASKYGMALAFDNLVKVGARAGDVSFGASWRAGEAAGGDNGAVAPTMHTGPSRWWRPGNALAARVCLKTVHDAGPVMAVAWLRYALSRRTDLYATAAYAKARDGSVVALARDEPGFGSLQRGVLSGMQHRF